MPTATSSDGVWHPTCDLLVIFCQIHDYPPSGSMKWEQAGNGASSIDFPVVRCRLSASWIGRFNSSCWAICHDQSLPFKAVARNKALRT